MHIFSKYTEILTELVNQSQDPLSCVTGSAGRFFLFDELTYAQANIVVGDNAIYHCESKELYKGQDNFIHFLNWIEAVSR